MILEIFRKDISIFIFNENVYLARAIKERLVTQSFDAHFYTDETLVRQAIYLALPHIVLLPAAQKFEKLAQDIRRMSREIQIIAIGSEEEYETILAMKRKNFIDDYVLNPIQHLDSIDHRVQLSSERWVLMNQLETQPTSSKTLLHNKHTFIEDANKENIPDQQIENREDLEKSLFMKMVEQDNEETLLQLVLEKLNQSVGISFVYFAYDSVREVMVLDGMSFGQHKHLKGLGIKLSELHSTAEFFLEPGKFKIFKDFMAQVFNVDSFVTQCVQSGEDTFGLLVALEILPANKQSLLEYTGNVLSMKIDLLRKGRFIFNNVQVDKSFHCLNNKVFYSQISDEISRSRRIQLPVSLVVFEVRGKLRAETRHASAILVKVLKRFTRVTDHVGRMQGDRFGLTLVHCTLSDAVTKARKLQSILRLAMQENNLEQIEVRAGVTSYPDQHADAMSLLEGGETACDLSAPYEVCCIEQEPMELSETDNSL
ncbi:MAG: diguanylate cyclase [Bdellovibrionaceae bacterium]|nr:diguanylate cyclase [Pseudobdellovibrionaceae bacterium]